MLALKNSNLKTVPRAGFDIMKITCFEKSGNFLKFLSKKLETSMLLSFFGKSLSKRFVIQCKFLFYVFFGCFFRRKAAHFE